MKSIDFRPVLYSIDGKSCKPAWTTVERPVPGGNANKISITIPAGKKQKWQRVKLFSFDTGRSELEVFKQGFYMPGDPAGYYTIRSGEEHPYAGWRKPVHLKPKDFWSHSLTAIPDGRKILLAGFTESRRFETLFVYKTVKGSIRLECWCELAGLAFKPGAEVKLEEVMTIAHKEMSDALTVYAAETGRINQARTSGLTDTGWIDWQYFREEKNEADIKANIRALAELRKQGYPLDYIIIDGGWCDGASEWLGPCDKFPAGMGKLSQYVRKYGMKFGLWFAPYITNVETEVARKHPDWMVINKKTGKPLVHKNSNVGTCNVLDFTVPGARKWLAKVVKVMAEDWQVRYLKLDGPNPAHYKGGRFHDENQTEIEQIHTSLAIIRETCGDKVVIEGEGIYLPSVGYVDTQRTQQDNFPFWYYPNNGNPRIKENMRTDMVSAFTHNTLWKNHRENVILRESPSPYHALKFQNPDLKDPILPENELLFQITGSFMAGGAMLLSDDMPDLLKSPKRIKLISQFLPPWEDAARPLDSFNGGAPAIWYLPIERDFETWWMVGVYNWTDEFQDITVPLKSISGDIQCCAWELWTEQYLGEPVKKMTINNIQPHACRLIALRPKLNRPQFMGSTIHLYQGASELTACDWQKNCLSLKIKHFNLKDQKLIFRHPRNYTFKKLETNAKDHLVDDRQKGLITIHFNANKQAKFKLKYTKNEPREKGIA